MSTLSEIVDLFRSGSPNIAAAFDEVERRLVALEPEPPPPPPPPVKSLVQTIQNGTTLTGRVDWTAVYDGNADDVPDDPGSVQFFVDGALVLTESNPPFGNPTGFWDSTTVDDGDHTFQVKAYDDAGAFIIESELATAAVDNVADPPPPPPPTARLIAQAVYDGYPDVGDVPLWKPHGEQVKADDRLTIVNDPLGQRGKVMRVHVKPGDNNVAGSGTGERAEVMCGSSVTPDGEGEIVAVRTALMLPSEFASSGSGWNVPLQWHDSVFGGQSPIQFSIQNGRDFWVRTWGGTFSNGSGSSRNDWMFAQLERNRWYDIVIGEIVSSDPATGRLVIVLNGQEVLNRACANLYRGSGRYWKQGWYRAAYSSQTTLYDGNTQFWTADTLEEAVAAAAR